MPWQDRWRPASFRGIRFRVDVNARMGGRRGISFEFPKRDDPSDEDMGRRAKRAMVAGWLIGSEHVADADALEQACNQEGPGLLIHPLMGEMQVRCETYTRTERRNEGNMTFFEMSFVEAGTPAAQLVSEATQAIVASRAVTAKAAIVSAYGALLRSL